MSARWFISSKLEWNNSFHTLWTLGFLPFKPKLILHLGTVSNALVPFIYFIFLFKLTPYHQQHSSIFHYALTAQNPSFFNSLWRRDNAAICHIIKSINNECLQNEDQKTQKWRHILKSVIQIFVYCSLNDRHRTTRQLVFKEIEPIRAIISKPGFIPAYFVSFCNALFSVP